MSKETHGPTQRHVLPCSCIVTEYPGHVHTMMCQAHQREYFANASLPMSQRKDIRDIREFIQPNNLDLIGG
jgi:hypothetical protein